MRVEEDLLLSIGVLIPLSQSVKRRLLWHLVGQRVGVHGGRLAELFCCPVWSVAIAVAYMGDASGSLLAWAYKGDASGSLLV